MTDDIPGSRGHPVTGKVSGGSARMTPSYRPKKSFEMNPSIVTAIQIHTAGWTTAGSILPGALQLPIRAELLLAAGPSPGQREGSHGGCLSRNTRQMQRCAAICEKRSQAWLVPLWTVSKLPLWQQRCCREINVLPPRLQEPTTALGKMLPSVQAGLLWLFLETNCFCYTFTYQEKDTLFPLLKPRPHLPTSSLMFASSIDSSFSFTRALSFWKNKMDTEIPLIWGWIRTFTCLINESH